MWAVGAYLFFCKAGGLPDGIGAWTATPEYLARLLPTGLIGLVVAGMLAAEMSTDSSYILTWATVIYNDLITPCLRRPMSEKAQLLTIRTIVFLIGVFLVFYGLVYELPGTAFDYLIGDRHDLCRQYVCLIDGSRLHALDQPGGSLRGHRSGRGRSLDLPVVNAMADAAHKIAPATAGLSGFALAFGGLLVGSLVGRCFAPKHVLAEELTETPGGQN